MAQFARYPFRQECRLLRWFPSFYSAVASRRRNEIRKTKNL
jgi:hypothetical protein